MGARRSAFDAEIAAIERALQWFTAGGHGYRSIVVNSDSTSPIARAGHTGAGPGQKHALTIHKRVSSLRSRTADIT